MSASLRLIFERYRVQILVLASIWCAFALSNSLFRGPDGIYAVLLGFALLGLVTMGLAVTMIAGELDMSVAGVAAVAGAIAVRTSGAGLVVALACAVLTGLVIGLVQGYVVARLKINSLIITVGTLVLFGGLSYVICNNEPISVASFSVSDPFLIRYGVVSLDILIALVVMILVGGFIAYTKQGREIVAIGGAREEAKAAGVSSQRPLIISFAISGTLAALAGSMAAMKAGNIAPGAYSSILLQGVSAALIGGISLYGGRGSGLNVFFGVATISLISVGLSIHGAQDYTVQLVTGLILLIVVVLELISSSIKKTKHAVHKFDIPKERAAA